MNENLTLAKSVRDVCLQYKAQWKIRINGYVDVEVWKNIPKGEDFYYKFKGQIKCEDDLAILAYRLEHKKPPD